jgi:thiol-disulfide isomerase/thioredoxin
VSKSSLRNAVCSVCLSAVVLPFSGFAQDLTGPSSREAILKHSPDWEATAAAYQPDMAAVGKLRGLSREVLIEVYFGSWCSDCAARLPAFFKILDMVDSPLIRVRYTGVPRKKEDRAPYLGGREIERVPTFIIFVDGREAGRIVESPRKTIEEDLVAILGL